MGIFFMKTMREFTKLKKESDFQNGPCIALALTPGEAVTLIRIPHDVKVFLNELPVETGSDDTFSFWLFLRFPLTSLKTLL